jgi:hypothetical protein
MINKPASAVVRSRNFTAALARPFPARPAFPVQRASPTRPTPGPEPRELPRRASTSCPSGRNAQAEEPARSSDRLLT